LREFYFFARFVVLSRDRDDDDVRLRPWEVWKEGKLVAVVGERKGEERRGDGCCLLA